MSCLHCSTALFGTRECTSSCAREISLRFSSVAARNRGQYWIADFAVDTFNRILKSILPSVSTSSASNKPFSVDRTIGQVAQLHAGNLYLGNEALARDAAWLDACAILKGRTVRCLRLRAADNFPAMRQRAEPRPDLSHADIYQIDDALQEPILGYAVTSGADDIALAQLRRKQVKVLLLLFESSSPHHLC